MFKMRPKVMKMNERYEKGKCYSEKMCAKRFYNDPM